MNIRALDLIKLIMFDRINIVINKNRDLSISDLFLYVNNYITFHFNNGNSIEIKISFKVILNNTTVDIIIDDTITWESTNLFKDNKFNKLDNIIGYVKEGQMSIKQLEEITLYNKGIDVNKYLNKLRGDLIYSNNIKLLRY